jgi:hypothetical protein
MQYKQNKKKAILNLTERSVNEVHEVAEIRCKNLAAMNRWCYQQFTNMKQKFTIEENQRAELSE